MKKIHQAVNLSDAFSKDSDMSSREDEIIKGVSKLTGFMPKKNIWRSKYWGKNLGASHWLGDYNGKKAVLKIQGVKPEISEIYMIGKFSKQNRSTLIGPPIVYTNLPWDDVKGYEATIAEYASGNNVIVDGKIVSRENIATFMNYYSEYRKNCIPISPWLPRPKTENNWQETLDKLFLNSHKAYPEHPFREAEDQELAKQAYKVLSNIYKNIQLEFMHGHFSCKDLIYQNEESKNVVLFSNLFWKWRFPFFDAIFAYHWFMFELARVKDISPDQVESQRKIWLDEIFKTTNAFESKEKERLLNAALLERAVAGFIIDGFLMDIAKPISKHLIDSNRIHAKTLINELF